MDLYGTNTSAISMGNARRQEVRDFNDRVKQHNDNVTDTIQGLQAQAKSATQVQEIKDTAQGLWTGSKMPDKIAAYKKWKADRAAGKTGSKTNPTENNDTDLDTQANETQAETTGPQETTSPPEETVNEGGDSAPVSEGEAAENAGADIGESLENAGAKDAGAALTETAVKDGGEEVAESLGSKLAGGLGKAAGVAGKGAGALMGGAMAGMDLYEDIKGGKIQGNNTWEKASNVLQIGGGIADVVGTFFPPAALLGGVLDLASGATDAVGEKLDETKQEQDLSDEGTKEQDTPEAAPVIQQATLATGRVQ